MKKEIIKRKETNSGDLIPLRFGGPSPNSGKSRIASAISSKTLLNKDEEYK